MSSAARSIGWPCASSRGSRSPSIAGMDLVVREMELSEAVVRIGYFHDAPDEHLENLGVDRARLPTREEWQAFYEADYARPVAERENYTLAWLLNGEIIGFSSTDQITFGDQAFMHLHIISSRQASVRTRHRMRTPISQSLL